jgi:hypothetical protein
MNSLVRCVMVTTRQLDADLTSQLGRDGLPNLEIIRANYEELAQWFSLENSVSTLQPNDEPTSSVNAEAAAV